VRIGAGLLTAAALALGLAAPARAVQVVVRPAEGPAVKGRLTGLDGKTLRVHAEDGPRGFRLADLMDVEAQGVKPPDGTGCARIYTAAGDVIPAKVALDPGGKLVASGPWTARFEVSTKDLAGILMPAGVRNRKVAREMLRRGRRKDKLVLDRDELEGSFEGLTRDGLKFNSVLGLEEYKLAEVLALAFTELKPFALPESTYYVAELAGGGQVLGAPLELEGGKLRWRTLGGMQLKLTLAAVSALRVRNGKVTFLSDLRPAKAEQKPFIEGLPFLWKWRRDADVFGKPLALGGQKFRRGLGVAAFTRLTYQLGGKFKRFKARAGVCDSVAVGGKTAFKVLVDGRELFNNARNPLTRRAKPRAIDVEVKGGKVLELIVDFGPDGSDLGDIGGWGGARLIK